MTIGAAGAFPLPTCSLRATTDFPSPSLSGRYAWSTSVICPSCRAGGGGILGPRRLQTPLRRLRGGPRYSWLLDLWCLMALRRPSHTLRSLPKGMPASFEGVLRQASVLLRSLPKGVRLRGVLASASLLEAFTCPSAHGPRGRGRGSLQASSGQGALLRQPPRGRGPALS